MPGPALLMLLAVTVAAFGFTTATLFLLTVPNTTERPDR